VEHSFTVGPKEAGERIDRYLCRKFPDLSRKQIKSLLDGGRVNVDRRRVVIAGWELTEGDHVEVRIPEGFKEGSTEAEVGEGEAARPEAAATRPPPHAHVSRKIGASIERFLEREKRRGAARAQTETEERKGRRKRKRGKRGRGEDERGGRGEEARRLKVYYQDRDIIVVEKPAGILSIPEGGKGGKENVMNLIRSYMRRKIKGSRHSFISPLHRLDAETSGVMVFALSKAGQKLSKQFKDHSIERVYQAVVAGRIEGQGGVIKKPLEKGRFGGGRKARASSGGRDAVTEYAVKERYKSATLLDVRVRTGRTHQIRVHLASEGHPLLGDSVYSPEEGGSEMGFGRHALHAHYLAFNHPVNGKRISYRSALPGDMRELVDRLRESG